MATLDDREKGFEKKFAHDQELKFKAEARRNNLLAAWAAQRMGMSADKVADYAKEVRRADLEEQGDDDVFRKIRADFDAKGLEISDEEIRETMGEFLAQAVAQLESGSS